MHARLSTRSGPWSCLPWATGRARRLSNNAEGDTFGHRVEARWTEGVGASVRAGPAVEVSELRGRGLARELAEDARAVRGMRPSYRARRARLLRGLDDVQFHHRG